MSTEIVGGLDSPSPSSKSAAVPMLKLEGVSHIYGSGEGAHEALQNLSFEVLEGQFTSIVGPSGAGKTTLLRILSGLLKSTSGSLYLQGEQISGVPKGMAMVFQDYGRSLLPWLSVAKNVIFPLKGSAVSPSERKLLVAESLAAVGLTGFEDRYPWQLSGGMQQRVAIARALVYRPRLLLMDEPFASLDAQTRAELEDLVLKIRTQYNVTVLFVTHDIDESVYLADRILVLSKAPARLVEDIIIELSEPRDQIATKEDERFVQLRGHVARLIRSGGEPIRA